MNRVRNKIMNAVIAFSKNRCSYPGCTNKIIDKNGTRIGNVCHIEAREKGGPRYNKSQTDEERNGFDNLMCLCYEHHQITHDLKYTVEDLKKMKYNAENDIDHNYINISSIYKSNKDQESFIMELEEKNKKSLIPEDFKAPIDFNANYIDIQQDIETSLEYLNEIHLSIIEEIDNLNSNIIKQLKKLKYDVNVWVSQPVYNNPFESMMWEELHLGLYNHITIIKLRLLQLNYLYYQQYVIYNPNDVDAKIQLNRVMNLLKNASGNVSLID